MELENGNCLELMRKLKDNSIDLIFCDPPYALGSEIIIRQDGKPDYKKAVDFMNRWEMPDGKFWQEWYKEAFRVLKHGGHCAMFGIDRQTFLFQYYAVLNEFVPKQSLYWYFISNFPKSSDLSKNIDKRFGLEREVVGKSNRVTGKSQLNNDYKFGGSKDFENSNNITAPNHPLAQKYNGLKYSVAPLKQTCEEIMVFQKPYKYKSCLNDVLAYEEGDESITVGALDIEGNRVKIDNTKENDKRLTQNLNNISRGTHTNSNIKFPDGNNNQMFDQNGRYPAQTFIDSGTAEVLDLQSGFLHGSGNKKVVDGGIDKGMFGNGIKRPKRVDGFVDHSGGGCSRILHKCDYEDKDFDLFIYAPKVSKSERNEGLEGFEEKQYSHDGRNKEIENPYQRNKSIATNNHPTVKPTKLLSHILKLFKTPNPQTILDPFMGSGSMGISAVDCGYDYIGYELDKDYFQIAKARIENAKNKRDERLI